MINEGFCDKIKENSEGDENIMSFHFRTESGKRYAAHRDKSKFSYEELCKGPIVSQENVENFERELNELQIPLNDLFFIREAQRGHLPHMLLGRYESCEDFLSQVKEYRQLHHLEPLGEITDMDIQKDSEIKYEAYTAICKKYFGDDIK